MGVWRKKAGQWDQLGVDPMAVRWATVTGGVVTTVTNADGSVDEVHTFTANGTLTVTKAGYAEVLLVGGGSFGASGTEGAGGRIVSGLRSLPSGALAVVVGAGGAPGQPSLLGALTTYSSPYYWGGAGSSASGGTVGSQTGFPSSITGTALDYARGGQASPRVNFGDGKVDGSAAGSAGIVIVRVRITDALPLPAATGWAQITGGAVTEYTKPDGSVMEVHRFNASGTLTVVAAGYAECLLVSGGGSGASAGYIGGGGRVADGLRALPAGALAVTVGAAGSDTVNPRAGEPSSLGGLATGPGQADQSAGAYSTGAGGTIASPRTGYTSAITGTAAVYAPAGDNTKPGGGGTQAGPTTPAAGVVIVAVQKTPPTASGVVASGGDVPAGTTFVGDGVNGVLGQTYRVHKFTADGTLTVTTGGEVEVLLVGGGGAGGNGNGGGGGGGGAVVAATLPAVPGVLAVKVGAGGTYPRGNGAPSLLGSINAPGGGGGGNADDATFNMAQSTGFGASSGGGASVGAGVPAAIPAGGGMYGNAYGSIGGIGATDGSSWRSGGGGGGRGGAGGNGANGSGGAAGAGLASSISGSAVTYAAGGRAGPGGAAPTANTGTGGGGAATGTAGAAGIVIVRYKVAA